MALRGRRIDNFVEKCVQEVYPFKFHQPVFKKVALADLNSLRQKRYQISVKNLFFDNSFYKKGPVGHFGTRNDRTIRIRKFFDEIGL